MDLLKGYWQVEIDPADRHKTAFTWDGKCLQYTRVAFGLTSAGAIFSRCVSKPLEEVQTKKNIVSYIDDVLVYATNMDEFIVRLCRRPHPAQPFPNHTQAYLVYDSESRKHTFTYFDICMYGICLNMHMSLYIHVCKYTRVYILVYIRKRITYVRGVC